MAEFLVEFFQVAAWIGIPIAVYVGVLYWLFITIDK